VRYIKKEISITLLHTSGHCIECLIFSGWEGTTFNNVNMHMKSSANSRSSTTFSEEQVNLMCDVHAQCLDICKIVWILKLNCYNVGEYPVYRRRGIRTQLSSFTIQLSTYTFQSLCNTQELYGQDLLKIDFRSSSFSFVIHF
jgi:hypothetical protein